MGMRDDHAKYDVTENNIESTTYHDSQILHDENISGKEKTNSDEQTKGKDNIFKVGDPKGKTLEEKRSEERKAEWRKSLTVLYPSESHETSESKAKTPKKSTIKKPRKKQIKVPINLQTDTPKISPKPTE